MEEVQIGDRRRDPKVRCDSREEEESLKQMFRQLKAIKPGQTAASFATALANERVSAAAKHIVAVCNRIEMDGGMNREMPKTDFRG